MENTEINNAISNLEGLENVLVAGNGDSYCDKLIRAIEQCVEVYNKYSSKHFISIKEKPLKANTIIVKKHFNELRIAVLDSLSCGDKLRELVYVFSTNACLLRVFSLSGNWHVWDATMRYVLFGECGKEEFQIRCELPKKE